MHLQISALLLFVLFTAGHSLSCYQCINTCTQTTCNSGVSSCYGLTAYYGDLTSKVKGCYYLANCLSGSMNLGSLRSSLYCCSTDLCNTQDAPDPNTNAPNGKKCYYCDGQDCSKTLSCSGSEDRCLTETASLGNQSLVYKGCISKSFCDTAAFTGLTNYTCCEGNLCNGAKSVTQSFLFLCFSLISFILMH